MRKFLASFLWSFLLLSVDSFAALQYRSGTEILSENSEALELRYQAFTKKSSYDETGAELISGSGDSFSVNDWMLKYTRGIYSQFETSFLADFRNVKSESKTSSAINSGLESVGFEVKYLVFKNKRFKNALNFHFKKAMFTNVHYDISTPPPTDKVALGDDGSELGMDYLLTYNDKYLKYDFKFGYNKPSTLSSELLYNAEAIHSFSKLFLMAGIGGIKSLNNDPYTDSTSLKPLISSGNSRLFNSINREKNYLYAGAQYALGDFIIGLRGETIFKGRSTDKGETILLSFRWEKNESDPNIQYDQMKASTQEYFAEGFVEKVSASGKMVKINIGSDKRLALGTNVDVFNINEETRLHPMASGTVIKIGSNWSIISINKQYNKSPIQTASFVKAY